MGQLGQRQRRQRRLFGRFQHAGAARGDPRRDLAGDHRDREIPGRDGTKHADRLLEGQETLVRDRAFHDIATDPPRFLGEPVDKGGAIGDLAARLGDRLAHLGGQDDGQILGIGEDQLVPFAHHHGTVLGGASGPGSLRRHRGIDRRRDRFSAQIGHLGDGLAGRRVGDGETPVLRCLYPDAIDIGVGAKQGWIVQLHGSRSPGMNQSASVPVSGPVAVSITGRQRTPVHRLEGAAIEAKPVRPRHLDIL